MAGVRLYAAVLWCAESQREIWFGAGPRQREVRKVGKTHVEFGACVASEV